MISKTFSAALQYSAPIFVEQGKTLAISISGTFNATVQTQKLVNDERDSSYPSPTDAAWDTLSSYTAPAEVQVADGDNCWYRVYCSIYASGSPVIKLKV